MVTPSLYSRQAPRRAPTVRRRGAPEEDARRRRRGKERELSLFFDKRYKRARKKVGRERCSPPPLSPGRSAYILGLRRPASSGTESEDIVSAREDIRRLRIGCSRKFPPPPPLLPCAFRTHVDNDDFYGSRKNTRKFLPGGGSTTERRARARVLRTLYIN